MQKGVIKIKKAAKIILVILGVLILILGILAFWQRDNLRLLFGDAKAEAEAMQANLEVAEQTLAETFDLDKIKEDAADIYESGMSVESDQTTQENSSVSGVGEPAKNEPSAVKKSNVEALITQFYVLQSKYTGLIGGIEASAFGQLNALPKEKRTKSAMLSIARGCISQAYSLQGQCDSEVYSLLSQLRSALEADGMDLSIASNLESCYESEKGLKKAELISKYVNYLS